MDEKSWKIILSIILLTAISVWMAVIYHPADELKIVACDVGQGDASLIVFGRNEILIDGGPDSKVIGCLNDHIPFWDRTIELVILSHPQKDHFVGLLEVFKKYKIERFMVSELNSDTQEFRVLEELVGGSDTLVIRPRKGQSIRWGLIYLDILHPSGEFFSHNYNGGAQDDASSNKVLGSANSSRNANDFSVVLILSFGDFDALFTGDIGPDVTDDVMMSDVRDVEYLKVPHHGSKNGLTEELLKIINPEVAVISSGKNNPHGHPHRETLELLEEYKVKTMRTDQSGDVVVRTDGKSIIF